MRRTFTVAVILIIAIFFSSCKTGSESFVIENNLFTKTFSFNKENAGRILVDIQFRDSDKEIAETDHSPYFEFVIDNKIISSNDKLWVFTKSSERKMGNGGTEYTLTFEGVQAPVDGLQLVLLQQIFTGSTLMREKLMLLADGESFKLNKLHGKLHFKYPSYAIQNEKENKVTSTEIRIASFEKKPITFGNKKKGNHMYYPDIIRSEVTGNANSAKGPVLIVTNGKLSWLTAYEHASQDDLNGLLRKRKHKGKAT